MYGCAEFEEYIEIVYTADDNTNVGTRYIQGATTSNSDYVITLSGGQHSYTITTKFVSVNEVVLKQNVTMQYSLDLGTKDLAADMFIESMPSYLRVESCSLTSLDIGLGDNEVKIKEMVESGMKPTTVVENGGYF